MIDRHRLDNGKSSKLMCPSTYAPSAFSNFLADLINGDVYVDIIANNASTGDNVGVDEVGTPLSTDTFLKTTTAQRFGGSASSKPDGILDNIADQFWWNAQIETITATASAWQSTEGGAPYTQVITQSSTGTALNVNANSNPVWDIYIPDNATAAQAADQIDACSLVNKLVTGTGEVTLYCYQACPSVNFQIRMKGAYGTWITS